MIPISTASPFRQDLEASGALPILTLVLVLARQARLRGAVMPTGALALLEGWAAFANDLLTTLDVDAPTLQLARTIGARAVRIAQGYETGARDKAYQVLVEHVEGARGLDRPLTDEELITLNNGLLHAFAGYAAFLDHIAGAVAGGV